ncbi:MAG: hypothetical protein QW745_07760 [Thermoplasmata archaeon]
MSIIKSSRQTSSNFPYLKGITAPTALTAPTISGTNLASSWQNAQASNTLSTFSKPLKNSVSLILMADGAGIDGAIISFDNLLWGKRIRM